MGEITLNQLYQWLFVIVGVLGLFGTLFKYFKDLKATLTKPLNKIQAQLDSIDEQVTTLQGGLASQLRISIKKDCERYLHQGYATIQQREVLSKALNDYKALGGNSFIESLVNEVMDLPFEGIDR